MLSTWSKLADAPKAAAQATTGLKARLRRILASSSRAVVVPRPDSAPAAQSRPDRFEVVNSPKREQFVDLLQDLLHDAHVGFTTGGVLSEIRPRIHARLADARFVLASVQRAQESTGSIVLFDDPDRRWRPTSELISSFETTPFTYLDLWVCEHPTDKGLVRPQGAYSVVELDFWSTPENSYRGDGYTEAPRPNAVVTSMRKETLDRILGVDGRPRQLTLESGEGAPNLYQRDFPIDLVYTWVDDKDPAWRAVKDSYSPVVIKAIEHEGRGHLDERFRNRDELKYSLRSIEMFAPFVRKIFLVTMDQVPDWLDTSNPKIEVISHRDIYSDPSALPTFNSSSIETQLHHIEGLAEHFIYFNDDVFLGRPCNWDDFFLANGSPKFFPATHSIAASVIDDKSEEYLVADKNAIELFRREFGFVVHRVMAHVPHAVRRSVLYELEEKFGPELDACQRSRFRSSDDLRPIAFMAHHYGFATGRAIPARMAQRYLALWKPTVDVQLRNVRARRHHKTFCINDVGVSPEREREVDQLVGDFLSDYFPLSSSFERETS